MEEPYYTILCILLTIAFLYILQHKIVIQKVNKDENYKINYKRSATICNIPFIFFFLAGVDSIYDNGYFIQFIIVIIALCYICYKTISKEELKILTMDKLLNK